MAQKRNAVVVGITYMILASAAFAVVILSVRQLSASFSVLQIMFFRNVIATLVLAPWLLRVGLAQMKTDKYKLYAWRTFYGYFGAAAWFYAISIMPLADAVALHFTMPLFTVLAAIAFLGESVGLRRGAAIAAGFVGAMVIVRPGFVDINMGAVIVLIAAAAFSGINITTKILARTEPEAAIVFYFNLLILPISLIPALWVWKTPGWGDLHWILLVGIANAVAQIFLTRSFAAAEASIVIPFDFLRLIFVAIFGFLFFAEIPHITTGIGALIIFAASVYIARREAMIARRRIDGAIDSDEEAR